MALQCSGKSAGLPHSIHQRSMPLIRSEIVNVVNSGEYGLRNNSIQTEVQHGQRCCPDSVSTKGERRCHMRGVEK